MAPLLICDQVQKYFGNRGAVTKALNGLSFTVDSGEFVGIMGASGSGKTTLLNCISTIDRVTSGRIVIDGADVTRLSPSQITHFRRDKLGFVFQDAGLLDTLTARENISLALSIMKVPPSRISARVQSVAQTLNITDTLDKFPYQLSGGQCQRVSVARAIVGEPSLILADEPTGALDSKNARLLLENFTMLNQQLKATILMVTHDTFAASYAQRILFIKDGRIFNEIVRGNDDRKTFFNHILQVISVMGGDVTNAH
jgi:putative ABC transport system ATP-binding protein